MKTLEQQFEEICNKLPLYVESRGKFYMRIQNIDNSYSHGPNTGPDPTFWIMYYEYDGEHYIKDLGLFSKHYLLATSEHPFGEGYRYTFDEMLQDTQEELSKFECKPIEEVVTKYEKFKIEFLELVKRFNYKVKFDQLEDLTTVLIFNLSVLEASFEETSEKDLANIISLTSGATPKINGY